MESEQVPAKPFARSDKKRVEIEAQLGQATQAVAISLQVIRYELRAGVIKPLNECTERRTCALNTLPEGCTRQPTHPMTAANELSGNRQHGLDMSEDRNRQQQNFSHGRLRSALWILAQRSISGRLNSAPT